MSDGAGLRSTDAAPQGSVRECDQRGAAAGRNEGARVSLDYLHILPPPLLHLLPCLLSATSRISLRRQTQIVCSH